MNQEKARYVLRRMGDAAIDAFVKNFPGAIELPSDDPAVCWTVSGRINYAVVNELSGPNTNGPKSPLVLRIRLNQNPTAAIYDYVNGQEPPLPELVIADEPSLTIHALANQVPKLGGWLATWYESYCERSPNPPEPPIDLVANIVKADLSEKNLDFVTLGSDWWQCDYLWTVRAYEIFMPWFKGES